MESTEVCTQQELKDALSEIVKFCLNYSETKLTVSQNNTILSEIKN